jgi:GDP-D-mannose dehydratase
MSFKELGIDLEWSGNGVDKKGVDAKSGKGCSFEEWRICIQQLS